MTNAAQGARAALARSASGAVIALSEMATDDILAGLNDDQKAQLGAKLTPAAAAMPATPGDEPDDPTDPVDNEDEEEMKNGKPMNDCKASAAHDRIKAVAASDAAKSNPAAALAILADDDYADLNAAAVVKMVGLAGAPSASSDDDIGRQMLANMASTNPDLGNGNDQPLQEANHGWDDIHAEIRARRS